MIDVHAHVADPRWLPQWFFDGWLRTVESLEGYERDSVEARIFRKTFLPRMHDDADCTKLLAQMKEAGIEKTVLLLIDFRYDKDPDMARVLEAHRAHRALSLAHPELFCFSGVDPRRGRPGVELLDRALGAWGFAGFKIYPPCGYSPSDERLFPFYEVCRHHRVPVLTHVGPTSSALSFEHTDPMSVDRAARNFPEINFILAHGAVIATDQAALLASYRPNIFLDLSGFQSRYSKDRFKNTFRGLIDEGLVRKILFGTDWPFFRLGGDQTRWVRAIDDLRRDGILSDQHHHLITRDNALRVIPALSGARTP